MHTQASNRVSKPWNGARVRFPSLGKRTARLCWLVAVTLTATPSLHADALPDGVRVMEELRAALPVHPMALSADLQVRDRSGNIMRVFGLDMAIDWGAEEPTAEYVLRDAFGAERVRFSIRRPRTGPPVFTIREADAETERTVADMTETVGDLDLTWADLSLSFLWWDGGHTVGAERVRSRFCHIVDLTAPEDRASAYAGVRLWVDTETRLLMRADAFDRRSRPIRRLEVTTLRRIDDVWMIENMNITNHQTRERITLRVREVRIPGGNDL